MTASAINRIISIGKEAARHGLNTLTYVKAIINRTVHNMGLIDIINTYYTKMK
jgi:hypothetical protein